MWQGKKVSVVLPAYNEEKYIHKAVNEFFATKVVDEVLVINNNSTDSTLSEAKKTKARIVTETKQGYGHANMRGIREAKGDIIITCEPDGTFLTTDIKKFLAYVDDFDVVFGTRTSRASIWSGANMGWFLRLGNVAVAKLLEYVHNGPCLTDVGCTYKLLTRKAVNTIKGKMSVGASHFSPELMILVIRSNIKCIEIPVNYRGRIGKSKITGSTWKAFKLGLRMIWLIISYRFKRL
jgi:glycosyltransferase involved in cell wall biosynthesis